MIFYEQNYFATPSELTESTVSRQGLLYTQTEETVVMKPTWASGCQDHEQREFAQSAKCPQASPSQCSNCCSE